MIDCSDEVGLYPNDIESRPAELEHLLPEVSVLAQQHANRPAESSSAHADVAASRDSQTARTVQGQVSMLIEVAGDHVSATAKLLSPPYNTVAPWACARAVLETSALVV